MTTIPIKGVGSGKPQSNVERLGKNLVRKTFYDDFVWMVEREKEALQRLENFEHFPKFVSAGNGFIEITYCGICRKVSDRDQCMEILQALKKVAIVHRDIRPPNLLTKNGTVHLIDFGWCLFDGEKDSPVQYPFPTAIPGGFAENVAWNDSYAMKRCLERESWWRGYEGIGIGRSLATEPNLEPRGV